MVRQEYHENQLQFSSGSQHGGHSGSNNRMCGGRAVLERMDVLRRSLTNLCGEILYHALVHIVGFGLVFALKTLRHRHYPVSASSRVLSNFVGRFLYSSRLTHPLPIDQ